MTDITKVYTTLKKIAPTLPSPVIELVEVQTKDPFKVLMATILTARTKDELTITILPKLFERVQVADDLKTISQQDLEQLIYPIGFYRTKAKHLKALPHAIDELFDGKIPDDVDELTKLPGVGRKTANLVVAVAFHKPAICVDVHVHRILNRLGYIKTKDPYETEMTLRKILPKKYWIGINSLLVAYGQHTCTPVSPKCSQCVIKDQCAQVGVTKTR